MPGSRSAFAIPLFALCVLFGCKNNDTTTSPGAIASVTVNAPDSATSGQNFTIDVSATNVGIAGVHNGHLSVTLPSALTVISVDPSPGTTATFTATTVSWSLGTLDSNTSSTLHVSVTGMLPQGSVAQTLTIQGSLTADGINAGDAVASDTMQLNP